MASAGIRRKIDDLGRVVIPASLRRSLDMREGEMVEIAVDGDSVVLSKPLDRCVFCGSQDDSLHGYRNRQVCRACVASVGVLDATLREPAPAPPPRQATAEPRPAAGNRSSSPPPAAVHGRAQGPASTTAW